ncbi:MAG: hypothetical protein EYC70_08920 [Planctomycetota bacterium]|nr:MAG: hypothetical protein EYC70_08920 [Planctomycetota bacterium]
MNVVITGAGLLTTLGIGRETAFRWLLSGQAGDGEIPSFDPVKYLGDKGLRHWDRTALLLGSGAQLALAEAGLGAGQSVYAPEELGVVIGSTHGSIQAIAEFDQESVKEGPQYVNPADFANTTINQPAGRVSMQFNMPGLNTTISTGLASALDALDYAAGMLERGRIGALLCGAALGKSPEINEGYTKAGRMIPPGAGAIPFSTGRRGPALAEGGAMFVLETAPAAAKRGAAPLARLSGYGCAFTTAADGVQEAVAAALASAQLPAQGVSCVIAFASGSPAVDLEEGHALRDLGIRAPVTAPKAATGDCLEASGAIGVAVAIEALRTGRIPPIARLSAVDPDFADLDLVRGQPRAAVLAHALVTARDPEGPCSAVIVSRAH